MTTAEIQDRTRRAEVARAARREEILAAARQVFAERGFRGTTIADIAEAANIALGTIYNYFPSKEDVFAALNQRLAEIISEAITHNVPAGSLEQTTRARISNVFEACRGNRDLVRLVVLNTDPGSAVERRIREADGERSQPMIDAIAAAISAGFVRQGDARIITRLVQGLVTFAVYEAFVLSDGGDADRYRDACAEMIIAYLTPPQANAAAAS